MKLSVVPDSSERCTVWIAVAGSLASGLSALIAASSHLVTLPAKIFARVAGLSWRLSTPLDVVGDGDRADHHRQVERLAAGALGVGLRLLLRP